jgi:hypothetical protein
MVSQFMSNRTTSPGWSYKPGTPRIRGFDTPELQIQDALYRIKWFTNRIAEHRRKLEKTGEELSARKKRIQELKRGLTFNTLDRRPEEVVTALPRRTLGVMDTVKIRMSWRVFLEIYRKYRFRVQADIGADRVRFTDGSVIFLIPATALGELADRVMDYF